MIEIKVDGKKPKAYLIVADNGSGIQTEIKCSTIDAIILLSMMTQNVSKATKIPVKALTHIINKSPQFPTTMSINMDQIMKMFGKDR